MTPMSVWLNHLVALMITVTVIVAIKVAVSDVTVITILWEVMLDGMLMLVMRASVSITVMMGVVFGSKGFLENKATNQENQQEGWMFRHVCHSWHRTPRRGHCHLFQVFLTDSLAGQIHYSQVCLVKQNKKRKTSSYGDSQIVVTNYYMWRSIRRRSTTRENLFCCRAKRMNNEEESMMVLLRQLLVRDWRTDCSAEESTEKELERLQRRLIQPRQSSCCAIFLQSFLCYFSATLVVRGFRFPASQRPYSSLVESKDQSQEEGLQVSCFSFVFEKELPLKGKLISQVASRSLLDVFFFKSLVNVHFSGSLHDRSLGLRRGSRSLIVRYFQSQDTVSLGHFLCRKKVEILQRKNVQRSIEIVIWKRGLIMETNSREGDRRTKRFKILTLRRRQLTRCTGN